MFVFDWTQPDSFLLPFPSNMKRKHFFSFYGFLISDILCRAALSSIIRHKKCLCVSSSAVCDYCGVGDLYTHWLLKGRFEEEEVRLFAAELGSALGLCSSDCHQLMQTSCLSHKHGLPFHFLSSVCCF